MKWEQLVELGLELPEVTLEDWYGTPSLKVRKKGFVRLRPEGHSVVFLLQSLEEQEFLCESRPELYYVTDHYKGWATVLARLSELKTAEAKERLEIAWRAKAPPALIRAREQGGKRAGTGTGRGKGKGKGKGEKKPDAMRKREARAGGR